MTGFGYFKDVLFNKYAQFEGRARRSEYWYFTLFNMIVSWIVIGLSTAIGMNSDYGSFGMVGLIYMAAILIPSIGVIVRRLHDVGKSGWFYFIVLIPLVGVIWLFVLLVTDSQYGDNKYGPNPKGIGSEIDENTIQENLV